MPTESMKFSLSLRDCFDNGEDLPFSPTKWTLQNLVGGGKSCGEVHWRGWSQSACTASAASRIASRDAILFHSRTERLLEKLTDCSIQFGTIVTDQISIMFANLHSLEEGMVMIFIDSLTGRSFRWSGYNYCLCFALCEAWGRSVQYATSKN